MAPGRDGRIRVQFRESRRQREEGTEDDILGSGPSWITTANILDERAACRVDAFGAGGRREGEVVNSGG